MESVMRENHGVILLVEDNADLNNANRRALELRRYTTHTAFNLAQARECLKQTEPDIILLDVMLPDGDGFSFCNEIRGKTQAHILFLTAKTEHEDMVRGLATGGDDYITKPFHAEELLARINAVMRRRKMDIPLKRITKGRLTLNLVSDRAFVDGGDLLLSQKEFSILCLLIQNEGSVLGAEHIYESVWGQSIGNDKNAVQMAISRLRAKITPAGYGISVIRGSGYLFSKTEGQPQS